MIKFSKCLRILFHIIKNKLKDILWFVKIFLDYSLEKSVYIFDSYFCKTIIFWTVLSDWIEKKNKYLPFYEQNTYYWYTLVETK